MPIPEKRRVRASEGMRLPQGLHGTTAGKVGVFTRGNASSSFLGNPRVTYTRLTEDDVPDDFTDWTQETVPWRPGAVRPTASLPRPEIHGRRRGRRTGCPGCGIVMPTGASRCPGCWERHA